MVLPVSGFLPVPLPMMIPFMGAQSLVIGKMFGEGFQYGKRKISAMPNEEFNKLTFETMMSNARDEMQASIPTMIQAMQDMKPMVQAVIHEFTNYLSLVIEAAPEQAGQLISGIAHQVAPHEGEQIPSGHQKELDIFGTIAEQFPHVHEAFGSDLQQKVGVPLSGRVSQASLQRERLRRGSEMARLARQKREQIARGQQGLRISQKVQRIPFTRTQILLFSRYKQNLARINQKKALIKSVGDARFKAQKRSDLRSAQRQDAKYRIRIQQAKSVNLKGFELYAKWLAKQ